MLPAHACATLAQTDDSEALVPCGYLNESSGCPHGPHQRHDVRGHDVRGHSASVFSLRVSEISPGPSGHASVPLGQFLNSSSTSESS